MCLTNADIAQMSGLTIIAASCMAILWGIALAALHRGDKPVGRREDKNVVVGCLCKTRHKPGDCPRDRANDADLPPEN